MIAQHPQSDIDLFTDEALTDPYPLYDELRAAGAAVWLDRAGYTPCLSLRKDAPSATRLEGFSSNHGVMLNDTMNDAVGGVAIICTDPPRHDAMRKVLRRPLMMDATARLGAQAAAGGGCVGRPIGRSGHV